jgi:hypothetical protein
MEGCSRGHAGNRASGGATTAEPRNQLIGGAKPHVHPLRPSEPVEHWIELQGPPIPLAAADPASSNPLLSGCLLHGSHRRPLRESLCLTGRVPEFLTWNERGEAKKPFHR